MGSFITTYSSLYKPVKGKIRDFKYINSLMAFRVQWFQTVRYNYSREYLVCSILRMQFRRNGEIYLNYIHLEFNRFQPICCSTLLLKFVTGIILFYTVFYILEWVEEEFFKYHRCRLYIKYKGTLPNRILNILFVTGM